MSCHSEELNCETMALKKFLNVIFHSFLPALFAVAPALAYVYLLLLLEPPVLLQVWLQPLWQCYSELHLLQKTCLSLEFSSVLIQESPFLFFNSAGQRTAAPERPDGAGGCSSCPPRLPRESRGTGSASRSVPAAAKRRPKPPQVERGGRRPGPGSCALVSPCPLGPSPPQEPQEPERGRNGRADEGRPPLFLSPTLRYRLFPFNAERSPPQRETGRKRRSRSDRAARRRKAGREGKRRRGGERCGRAAIGGG